MKKALALLLLTVFVASLSMDVHEHEGGHEEESSDSYSYRGSGYALILTFDHAARDGLWEQDSNRFKVVFNGKVIKSYLPKDYKLHRAKLSLTGKKGKNTLHFIGQGRADSYGSQVDNIKLVRKGTSKNYIKNGDFEQGHKLGFDNKAWLIYRTEEFYGWKYTPEMEVGWGNIYNKYWPCKTHVCELDAHTYNSDIYQTFSID